MTQNRTFDHFNYASISTYNPTFNNRSSPVHPLIKQNQTFFPPIQTSPNTSQNKMPKPLKSTATTTGEAQPRWPAIKLKKGLILESVLEDQIYVIDVSSPPPFLSNLPYPFTKERT